MTAVDVSGGTPGLRLHGNPMYSGRTACFFSITVACTMVGAALGALDEFERILRTRPTTAAVPPARRGPRVPAHLRDGARKIRAAEAALRAAELHTDNCRAGPRARGPTRTPTTCSSGSSRARRAPRRGTRCRPGSTATRIERVARGERLERIFRDMATGLGPLPDGERHVLPGRARPRLPGGSGARLSPRVQHRVHSIRRSRIRTYDADVHGAAPRQLRIGRGLRTRVRRASLHLQRARLR